MIAILSVFVIVTISILITKVATVALTHTGMSREASRFQARSAFTGAGFTTDESERVVNHPVRRRIIMVLMLLGNVGIVSAISSLILSFLQAGETQTKITQVVVLVAGLFALWKAASSQWLDNHLSNVITSLLKRYTQLDVTDYASLMHLSGDYRVSEIEIQEDDWLDNRCLNEARLRDEGILILGIERKDGDYTGAPDGDTCLYQGDIIIVYGREKSLSDLDERGRVQGEQEHRKAVKEQESVASEEEEREKELEEKKEKEKEQEEEETVSSRKSEN